MNEEGCGGNENCDGCVMVLSVVGRVDEGESGKCCERNDCELIRD